MVATNISNKTERNQLNLTIRQQPWYQDWFRQRRLNPNMVQLSKAQQQELQQLVVSKGFLDPSDGHIDPAGNVSDFHGWKGLPTAAKIAIIGGVTAATAGAAGAFSGGAGVASGAGSGATAATGAGTTTAGALVGSSVPTLTSLTGAPIIAAHAAAPAIASAVAPTVASAVAPTVAAVAPAAAKAGFSIADAFKTGFAPALNAVTNLAATRAQTSSADRAAQLQVDAINHAADLQAKAAQDALDFTKGEYTAREARLAPYRQAGQEAMTRVSDLVRPGSGAAYLPPPTQYLPARALVGR